MKVSIVSDEVSLDFRTAAELATDWGINAFEVRWVGGHRTPYLDEWGRRSVERAVRDFGVTLSAISPGLFKSQLGSEQMREQAGGGLDDSLRLCNEWGVDLCIIFGVRCGDEDRNEGQGQVVDLMGEAAKRAAAAGVSLAIETEPGHYCDTGDNTAAIIEAVGSDSLRVNWDVGNSFHAGESPQEGYARLRPYIANVHAKDLIRKPDGSWQTVQLGTGHVGWGELIPTLVRDGFGGYVCVETHYGEKRVAESRKCAAWLLETVARAQGRSR